MGIRQSFYSTPLITPKDNIKAKNGAGKSGISALGQPVGAFLRQGAELWHETLDRKGRKMTTKALTTTKRQPSTAQDSVRPIVDLVLNALTSEHSRRAYEKALVDFLDWHAEQGYPPLSKALVQAYKTKLQGNGLAPSTINQRLSAIRKLARETTVPMPSWAAKAAIDE
jgi:hypothetical protein